MGRTMKRQALVVILVSLGVGAQNVGDAVQRERKKFEGTWKADTIIVNGKLLGPESADGMVTWDINGNWKQHVSDGKPAYSGVSAIEPTGKLKTLDLVITSRGDKAGKAVFAIYEFIDKDTYKICYAVPGRDRPKDFSAKEGSNRSLCTMKKCEA